MKRAVIWGALGALILGVASALPVSAAGAEAPKFGVLDMDRVGQGYRKMQEWNQEFQDFQRQQEQELQAKQKIRLLNDLERQEYTDLSATAAPTDANKQRLKVLEARSDQLELRLNDLRQKQGRTPEEDAEFKQLDGIYATSMSQLAALQTQLQASRTAKYEELSKMVTDSIDAAVKSVAEAQKLPIVLRKDAVLYGGTDITEAVLLKLNGPAPAPKPAQ